MQKFNARFIRESDENYPKHALNIYEENETAMERNEAVLNEFNAKLYLTEANDEIPGNCKYLLTLTQGPQNQKQTNTEGLAKLLKLKIGVKIMLTVNRDIQD